MRGGGGGGGGELGAGMTGSTTTGKMIRHKQESSVSPAKWLDYPAWSWSSGTLLPSGVQA